MKAARAIIALVLFFLLFGLPAIMSFQFLRMRRTPAASTNASGFNLLRGFLTGSAPPAAGAGSRPDAGKAGRTSTSASSASMPAFPPFASREDDGARGGNASSREGGPRLEAEGADALSSSFDNGFPVAYYGQRNTDAASKDAGKENAQSGSLGGGSPPGNGTRPSPRALAQSSRSPGAAKASGASLPGQSGQALSEASAQAAHAAAMSKDPQLLDGAKDHAGKAFDGNLKYRQNIPLDKYTDSFGNESIRPKAQNPVDLSP